MDQRTLKHLSTAELNSYQENGYIVVRDIFSSSEIEKVSEEYNQLFTRKRDEGGRLEATWDGDWKKRSGGSGPGSVLSIHNLQQHSATFTEVIMKKELLDVFEDIINDGVILHHTKAHLKPPLEGAPFPSHQDYHYFPYKDDSMLAAFIHLDDTTRENGGLLVFPASHKLGPQKDMSTVPGVHFLDQEQWNPADGVSVNARAGDVVIFSYLLVHASSPNTANVSRRMFLVQVAGANDTPLTDQHKSPDSGLVLRGRSLAKMADLDKRHL